MSLTINIYYTGKNGSARKFAREMVDSGLVERATVSTNYIVGD